MKPGSESQKSRAASPSLAGDRKQDWWLHQAAHLCLAELCTLLYIALVPGFFQCYTFYKYFDIRSLVLWKVSFRILLFMSFLCVWPCDLTSSQSFAYLLIPSKVDCGVFWSPAVGLVFPIMDNVSVSCLLLLTFVYWCKVQNWVHLSVSFPPPAVKHLKRNNYSWITRLVFLVLLSCEVLQENCMIWVWCRVSKWLSSSQYRLN